MTTTARDHWAGVADAYAATFARLCAGAIPAVIDASEIAYGDRVLDVGAGTGELATALVELGATVTAVEPDQDMAALCARRTRDLAVDVRLGGLPDLPVPDASYDVVVANFVVNHVDDPRAGLRSLVRAARPDGRVVATIWPSGTTDQARLFKQVMEAAGATPPTSTRLPPELDFERSETGLADLFEYAGLTDITTRATAHDWRVRPEVFWAGVGAGIGVIGRTYLAQETDVRRRMDAEFDRLRAPLMDGEELVLPSPAVLATGLRPR
ncbi:MAG TPA: class I SAM-dependent methyltransferase [Nocardioides sp.]|jgi:SAM-dependent methyltransferase